MSVYKKNIYIYKNLLNVLFFNFFFLLIFFHIYFKIYIYIYEKNFIISILRKFQDINSILTKIIISPLARLKYKKIIIYINK